MLVLCLFTGLCACSGSLTFYTEPSLGNNDNPTTETINNPLLGVWVNYEISGNFSTILVFNQNHTYNVVREGYDDSSYNNRVEVIQGTYEITNNQLRLIVNNEQGEVEESEGSFSVADGILSLNGYPMYQRLETNFDMPNSVLGTWREHRNKEFWFVMGSGSSKIESITFFSDGSYTTNPAFNYGQYRLMQDGRAIQVYSSNGRYEELITITHLGYGLMVFDGPRDSYILQRLSN